MSDGLTARVKGKAWAEGNTFTGRRFYTDHPVQQPMEAFTAMNEVARLDSAANSNYFRNVVLRNVRAKALADWSGGSGKMGPTKGWK